jgi:DNA-binding response OmpR family regulator
MPSARTPAPPPRNAGDPGRPGRLARIVCDDEAVQRRMIAAAVRPDFTEVLEVRDGTRSASTRSRAADRPCCSSTTPARAHGHRGVIRLRADLVTASLPILMLTASDDDLLEEQVLGAGADDYLRKPVAPEHLRRRVAAVLAARAGTASPPTSPP